jgi:uncharacterized RDD family membrane protein YckC
MDSQAPPEPLDTTAVIETPEQIRFQHKLVGPARRAVAYLIDLVVRAGVVFGMAIVAGIGGVLGEKGIGGLSTGVTLLVLFLLEWGYYVALEVLTGGRSIGKAALRLRVIKRNGTAITFGDSVLRNLLRAADFLPYGYALGLVVMGRDAHFRRLGDWVADTIVVSEHRSRVGAALEIAPPTGDEVRSMRARLDLSSHEIEALELFLRRTATLSPLRADELAEMVAPVFASRMQLRYRDATRFLELLYCRATLRSEADAHAR